MCGYRTQQQNQQSHAQALAEGGQDGDCPVRRECKGPWDGGRADWGDNGV